METVIRFSHINYSYRNRVGAWVLHDIDLCIEKGEYVLLCGGSGSGKSTMGCLINGLAPHFFGGMLQGSVSVLGKNTRDATVADLLSTVGLVFQNPDAQLFNSTVESEIAFGLESMGRSAREIEAQIQSTAEALGIAHLLDRSPNDLSGGEKRLAAIASVLSPRPPILVLDEPFAHLDWDSAERIRTILRELHRKGTTLLVIEQHIKRLLEDVTRCLVLEQGGLVFDGTPEGAWPILIRRHLLPLYPMKKMGGPGEAKPLLRLKEVIHHGMDGETVLDRVSFDVNEGEILAVVGRNGAGKTTLIKHFNGLLKPSSGELRFMGERIRHMPSPRMAGLIGLSFQNPNDQFFKTSVRDELMAGGMEATSDGVGWFGEVCSRFHLNSLLDESPYRLSEGQKRRVALASIVVMNPRILVLDEPTVGQDGRFLEALAALIISLKERGFTIVVVTHDLDFAAVIADRWVVLHRGQVVGVGCPSELERDDMLIQMGALARTGFAAGERMSYGQS